VLSMNYRVYLLWHGGTQPSVGMLMDGGKLLAWKMQHNSRACQRRIALRFTVLLFFFCDLTVDRAKHQYQILALQCEYIRLFSVNCRDQLGTQ